MQTTQESDASVALPTEFEMSTTSGSLMLAGGAAFAHIQRVAKMFSQSILVPKDFQGNLANCTIALEMAHRMGANPMAVMQNLYIVHGKPGWSAQFIIAAVNQCGKFSPLRYEISGTGDDRQCIAWATEKDTGDRLESPPVSIKMAKAEQWFQKSGSKWQTMPDLMLRYRAATFFGRLYAPDLLMGMQTIEELGDIDSGAETAKKAGKEAAAPMPRAKTIEVESEQVQQPELSGVPGEGDPSAVVAERLDKEGFSQAEYLNHLISQKQAEVGDDFFAIPDTTHRESLKSWNTVVFSMQKARKGGKK